MEILKLTFQIIGAFVSGIALIGWVLYFFFYRRITIEKLYDEEFPGNDYDGEEEFIDQMLQQ